MCLTNPFASSCHLILLEYHRGQRESDSKSVSWRYESETPGSSTFTGHAEWWGMGDDCFAPAAIKFQPEHDWDKVRVACHELAEDAQRRIYELKGLALLHASADNSLVNWTTKSPDFGSCFCDRFNPDEQ